MGRGCCLHRGRAENLSIFWDEIAAGSEMRAQFIADTLAIGGHAVASFHVVLCLVLVSHMMDV